MDDVDLAFAGEMRRLSAAMASPDVPTGPGRRRSLLCSARRLPSQAAAPHSPRESGALQERPATQGGREALSIENSSFSFNSISTNINSRGAGRW